MNKKTNDIYTKCIYFFKDSVGIRTLYRCVIMHYDRLNDDLL